MSCAPSMALTSFYLSALGHILPGEVLTAWHTGHGTQGTAHRAWHAGVSLRSFPHPHGHNVSVTRLILLGRISNVYFLSVMSKLEGSQVWFSRTCSEKSRTKFLMECYDLCEKMMGIGQRDPSAVSSGSLERRVAHSWSSQAVHQGWAVECPCSICTEPL